MTTNYEKIKQMSIDEMTAWILSYELYKILNSTKSYKSVKQWLQQESEG